MVAGKVTPTPHTLNLYTLHPTPYTLHPTPSATNDLGGGGISVGIFRESLNSKV